jgi:hypothetical protein
MELTGTLSQGVIRGPLCDSEVNGTLYDSEVNGTGLVDLWRKQKKECSWPWQKKFVFLFLSILGQNVKGLSASRRKLEEEFTQQHLKVLDMFAMRRHACDYQDSQHHRASRGQTFVAPPSGGAVRIISMQHFETITKHLNLKVLRMEA